ncbi:hypothetical protein ETI37_04430 [Lactobacillus mulieris]|jgi:hypothetical protein|uniref:hypothetical protein n=1 Tax=Lactobacillus TaxID=1578 RepID=UPI00019C7710|nr:MULTISPECIES: hypothetical protein [Lactobacillus]EFH29346.1 hypothetical protein HMPREF0526_10949 [Lactobacillus jensenii JV-V16]KAA9243610.1 hypothetical protein F6I33_06490 [Lactobacillus jensenii]MCW8094808.1 hypothetical protein [Lactobacillus mulieris]MCW8124305.1 hypothetical protein [Lactobacillus mulieris]MCZ9599337.1 hypothetical protein [Lactobacillus mulieris]
MRTAELRMKEETAVARREEQKNTVKALTATIKEMRPEVNESDLFRQIKKSVGSKFSLSDAEIMDIIRQNLK